MDGVGVGSGFMPGSGRAFQVEEIVHGKPGQGSRRRLSNVPG